MPNKLNKTVERVIKLCVTFSWIIEIIHVGYVSCL